MKKLVLSAACAAFLGAAAPVYAHITLETPQAAPNSAYKAVFRVPHGCDGSATTALRITIPEGVISAKPMPKPGWSLNMDKGVYARSYKLHGVEVTSGVREISWSGGSLPDDEYDEFVVSLFLTSDLAAGSSVYFPVVQTCAKGETHWTAIPASDGASPQGEEAAPALRLVAATAGDGGKVVTAGDIAISNAYLRLPPKGAPVAGAYLTIANNGHVADRLVSASLDVAGVTQIHEMKMDGNVMRMAELPDGVEIPAHGTITLAPGKLHLMLLDIKTALTEGEVVHGSLTFAKAGKIGLDFVVRGLNAGSGPGQMDMKMK